MVRRHLGILCTGFVALSLAQQVAAEPWPAPVVDGLADDAWGRAVRLGRDLMVATPSLIGPEVADPARRFAGNNLSCQNCHLDAGTSKFALPFVGVFADFPQYRAREGQVRTIEDRINGCMTRSMNGRELPLDGPEMQAIVAYMKFLSTGIPVGAATPGRGTAEVPMLDRAADPTHGAAVYAKTCASCHGPNGAGKRNGAAGDPKGYEFPPLYHNDGGGLDNATYFRKLLNNLRNHVAALGKDHVEIRVVDHGDGVVMLQMAKTDEKLAQAIDARKAEGVRFLICQNTLDERNIDWHTLYGVSQQDIVPSGVAELARLQMMGFVYIHP